MKTTNPSCKKCNGATVITAQGSLNTFEGLTNKTYQCNKCNTIMKSQAFIAEAEILDILSGKASPAKE